MAARTDLREAKYPCPDATCPREPFKSPQARATHYTRAHVKNWSTKKGGSSAPQSS